MSSLIIKGPEGIQIDCSCEDDGSIIVEWRGHSGSIDAAMDGWLGDIELPQRLVDWVAEKYDAAYDLTEQG